MAALGRVSCLLALLLPRLAYPQSAPLPAALERYDRNKNGVLDADERAAFEADQRKAADAALEQAGNGPDSEVVKLSPFEVSGKDDKGYYASNAMSGTRLNSKLEDLAGSVSVVTRQQLLDTAALDLNDIFQNELGTEGIHQFTDLTNDGRGDYDNVQGNPTGANRMRGLAQATIAVGGFTASSTIPIDVYNIDAVEIARGANSTLGGLGDAGGVVNLRQARANLTRQSTNVTLRADDWGGFRGSFDSNHPIVRNVLSARVSAVYEEKTWVRKPSVDRTNRQQISFTYKPTKTTQLSASYESFHEYANRANSLMPTEQLTYWKQNGSPTWDPTTQRFTINGVTQAPVTNLATLPLGVANYGSNNARMFQLVDNGKVEALIRAGNPTNNTNTTQQWLRSAGVPADPLQPLSKVVRTKDDSIYDWRHINLGAPNVETQRADIYNLNLQQILLNTRRQRLTLEGAWRREDQYNHRRMYIAQQDGVGNTLQVDITEKFLDGRPNPHVGQLFMGGVNPQVYVRPTFNDNYRIQGAYELDLRQEKGWAKWLGMHRVNGYGEYKLSITSPNSLRFHDSIVDNPLFIGNPLPTANLTNSNGLLMYTMFYFSRARGGIVDHANTGADNWQGVIPATTFAGTPAQWVVNTPATVREIYFSGSNQKKKVRTVGGSIQSFLFADRIIPTFGKRNDRLYTENSLGGALLGNFDVDPAGLRNFGTGKRWRVGDTSTRGVVVKPFRGWRWFEESSRRSNAFAKGLAHTLRGFSFFYNQSDTFQPADTAYNVFLEELPNPAGKSKEYGFSLSLFDDKLVLRATHQDTTQFHSRGTLGTIATRAMSLDFDLPGQTRSFDLYTDAIAWQLELHPQYTPLQAQEEAAKQIGIDKERIDTIQAGGKTISDVNDAQSKGWELELQYNPNRYWTTRFNGSQQIATDSNVSLFLQQLIAERMPTWKTITYPNGDRWWTTRQGSDGTPESYFLSLVEQPLNLAITNQGKRKTQSREYQVSVITKYQLAGLGLQNRFWKNSAVGGTFRWSSKASIGYRAGPADSDGVVRKLDRNRPVWDKGDDSLDLLYSYSTRLFRNKVRANFQLNVRNVTENGRVKGVAVNPDGQFWQYRIIEPRQFIFTASFDL